MHEQTTTATGGATGQVPVARPGLVLTDVCKDYGDGPVLHNVNLTIGDGEFFTLLGSSGSGKSTVLSLVAGFSELDQGEIELDSRSLVKVPPHKRGLGVVFQNYSLFPHLTALDNVCFPMRARGADSREMHERAHQALVLVGMEAFAQRYPAQLSGGQQQRAALARAVVFEPKLLLMDEPLGALDRSLRVQMEIEIRNLQKRLGLTVLYVTHDQEEALSMADRIGVLSEGCLVQVGSPREVYERPSSRFVAEFLGDSNLLSVTVVNADATDGRIDVKTAAGDVLNLRAASGAAAGEQVTLVIRPEALVLLGSHLEPPVGDTATHDRGRLAGTVTETVYLGPTIKYWVQLDSGTEIVALTSGYDFGAERITIGSRVTLAYRFADIHVLRDER